MRVVQSSCSKGDGYEGVIHSYLTFHQYQSSCANGPQYQSSCAKGDW